MKKKRCLEMGKENNHFSIDWVVYRPADINMTLKQHGITIDSQPIVLPMALIATLRIYTKSKDSLFILLIPNPTLYRTPIPMSSFKQEIEQFIRDNKSVRQSFQPLIVALPNDLKGI